MTELFEVFGDGDLIATSDNFHDARERARCYGAEADELFIVATTIGGEPGRPYPTRMWRWDAKIEGWVRL